MPSLHAYQRTDAAICAGRAGSLLAYETGGGKTPAFIEAARLAAPRGPWFITTKRNAVEQIRGEIATWAPGFDNYTLTHHEATGKFQRAGAAARVVIVDESDEARNVETDLFRILYPICRQASPYGPKRVILATATPVRLGPVDLIGQLILAGVFSFEQYQQAVLYYTDPNASGFGDGLDRRGADNLEQLAGILQTVMIRRTYADFGFRMPQPVFERVNAEAPGAAADAYKVAAEDFSAWYRSHRGRQAPPLARFVTLRRLQEMAKVPATLDLVRRDLAAGAHVLTFCEFRETAQALHRAVKGSGLVVGGDSAAARADTVETLAAADGAAAVFATTGALDSALNMQTVDRVNYVSMGWDPCTFTQTAGRAWRQGRKDPVGMRRILWPGDDLEKYVADVLTRKEDVLKTLGLLPTLNAGALLAV